MNGPTIRTVTAQRGYLGGTLASIGLFVLAAAGVAWVYLGMVTRDHWPIRWLEIDGAFERVSAEQLRATLTPLLSGSYFTVNLSDVRQAALRQPWVSEARVQKLWPDTVVVRIAEFQPVAHWTAGRLVAADGRTFEVPGANEIQGLPWLISPERNLDEVVAAWREFDDILLHIGLEIDRIRLDPRGAWYLELDNGTDIHIGRGEAVPRLRRLVRSWTVLTRGRPGAPTDVDLRYTNGFAVRWPETEEHHGKES